MNKINPELISILKDGIFQLSRLTGENLEVYCKTFVVLANNAVVKAEDNKVYNDLLEALKSMVRIVNRTDLESLPEVKIACETIAKAEGKL